MSNVSKKQQKKQKKTTKKLVKVVKKGPNVSSDKLFKRYEKFALARQLDMAGPNLGGRFRPTASLGLDAINGENAAMSVLGYLHNLIDPEAVPGARVPDMYNGPTATYQSVTTYQTVGNSATATSASDKGRFCYVFSPCLARTNVTWTLGGPRALVASINETLAWNGFSATNTVAVQDPNATALCPDTASSIMGFALRARPVGMSVWAEFEGSDLNNQGSIAANVLPAEVWAAGLSASATAGNRYYEWEILADTPGAYQGKVKNGVYCWWRPNGAADTQFYETDITLTLNGGTPVVSQVSYPLIVISGILPPSAAAGAPGLVRFRTCVNWEYQTSSRLIPTTPSLVSSASLEVAQRVLARVPCCMANDEHKSWINTVVKAGIGLVAGFALGGPVGAAVGALSGAGISFV